MPHDWDTFKKGSLQRLPGPKEVLCASEILDEFITEKSQQTIWSLGQFSTFNQEFRRIMARLVVQGHSNPEKLKKGYTKSINPYLHWKIQTYLKSEKEPNLKGELYSIKQVRGVEEYQAVLTGIQRK